MVYEWIERRVLVFLSKVFFLGEVEGWCWGLRVVGDGSVSGFIRWVWSLFDFIRFEIYVFGT